MSSAYSKRFLGVNPASSNVSVVVPSGLVWVIKDIQAFSSTNVSGSQCIIQAGGGCYLAAMFSGGANQLILNHWTGMSVMRAGETLWALINSGSWSVSISGYELTA